MSSSRCTNPYFLFTSLSPSPDCFILEWMSKEFTVIIFDASSNRNS